MSACRALILMLALAAQACGDVAQPGPASVEAAASKLSAPTLTATPPLAAKTQELQPARPSVYELSAKLEDQTGRALTLDAYRGKPVVLSMFYSGCKSMCPLLITHLHAIADALPEEALAQTRFLMVSFDPKRDTPEKMAALANAHAIDTKRWTLTRTNASSVQELAAVLDIRYRELPNGEFVHSSIITVLDGHGIPVLRGDDSELEPAQVAKAVSRVLQGP